MPDHDTVRDTDQDKGAGLMMLALLAIIGVPFLIIMLLGGGLHHNVCPTHRCTDKAQFHQSH